MKETNTGMDYKGRINIPVAFRDKIKIGKEDFSVLKSLEHYSTSDCIYRLDSSTDIFKHLEWCLYEHLNSPRFFETVNFRYEYLRIKKWWEKVMVIFAAVYRKTQKDFPDRVYFETMKRRCSTGRKFLVVLPFIRLPNAVKYFSSLISPYCLPAIGKECLIIEGGDTELLDIYGNVWKIFISKYLRGYSNIDYNKKIVLVEKRFGLEIWNKDEWMKLPIKIKNFDNFKFYNK